MEAITKEQIHVTLEFTNLAKSIAGTGSLELDLPAGTTFGEIVANLAERYPDMVGVLIEEDGRAFLNSNMFIINNDMSFPAFIMDECPRDGDRLTLVSVATGG